MLNQTCLHFGASKILLANLSGAKSSKKTFSHTKKNKEIQFHCHVQGQTWLAYMSRLKRWHASNAWFIPTLPHISDQVGLSLSNVSFFFLRRVCPCSPRLWVLLTFCSKRWRFLQTLLWPSQNATRSQTLITKIKDYKTSTTQTSTTPQNQTSTTLCEK